MSQTQVETNEKMVREFLKMMETRKNGEELAQYYHPDVVQTEYPNAILPQTAHRDLATVMAGADRGQQILQKEEYDLQRIYAIGEVVVVEVIWRGTVAIPMGKLQPGEQMVAYFAQIYEMKDGKIFRQRNYDCFEPFN